MYTYLTGRTKSRKRKARLRSLFCCLPRKREKQSDVVESIVQQEPQIVQPQSEVPKKKKGGILGIFKKNDNKHSSDNKQK
jgi:hypothetical protein